MEHQQFTVRSGPNCSTSGHHWTFSGSSNQMPLVGTPCDCGMVKWVAPHGWEDIFKHLELDKYSEEYLKNNYYPPLKKQTLNGATGT